MSKPIKAESAEFTKDPFYLIESNGPDKRYVASLRDKYKLQQLFSDFINQSEDEIQIRLRDSSNPEEPVDYSGELNKSTLQEKMNKHEEVLFHHGKYDFMLRNPYSEDYLVFDEHGLIFIYTDQDYSKLFSDLEVEHRPDEALIYEFDHWHIGHPEGEEKLAALIKDLKLEED